MYSGSGTTLLHLFVASNGKLMIYKYNNKSISRRNDSLQSKDNSIYLFVFHLLFKAPNILPSGSWSLSHICIRCLHFTWPFLASHFFSAHYSASFFLSLYHWGGIFIARLWFLAQSHIDRIRRPLSTVSLNYMQLITVEHLFSESVLTMFSGRTATNRYNSN